MRRIDVRYHKQILCDSYNYVVTLDSQATPLSRRERVWSARVHRVVTTPRSWRDQSDQVFRHDVILLREIHVPRAPVRLSAAQTRAQKVSWQRLFLRTTIKSEVVRAVAG